MSRSNYIVFEGLKSVEPSNHVSLHCIRQIVEEETDMEWDRDRDERRSENMLTSHGLKKVVRAMQIMNGDIDE